MARSSTYALHDRLARGRLEDRLRRQRARGLTYKAMAARLGVSAPTVWRWCRDLGIEQREKAS